MFNDHACRITDHKARGVVSEPGIIVVARVSGFTIMFSFLWPSSKASSCLCSFYAYIIVHKVKHIDTYDRVTLVLL